MEEKQKFSKKSSIYEKWSEPGNEYTSVRRHPGDRARGPCRICARESNGHHYSVQSCEGCKGFFRRSVLTKTEYICRLGSNNCDLINTTDRQRCQKCRLRKCFEEGMRENFVKKNKNKTKKQKDRKSVIILPFSFDQRVLLNEALEIWLNVTNHSEVHSTTNSILTTINQLKDLNGLAVFTLLTNTKCKLLAQHFTQMKYFKHFDQEWQKLMFQNVMPELMVLLSVEQYDMERRQMVMMNGHRASRFEFINNFQIPEAFVNELFDFCEEIRTEKYCRSIIAILAALTLFSSDRGYPKELDNALTRISTTYFELLLRFIERHYSLDRGMVSKILNILVKLRQINHNLWHRKELQDTYENALVANHDVKRVTTGVIRDMFRLKGHQIPQGQFSRSSSTQQEPPTTQQQSVIRPSVVVPIQPTPIQEPIQQEPRMGALMHEDVLEDLTVSFDMLYVTEFRSANLGAC